ncbi:hypothetical protein GQ457_01G017680 [Hibiscus cannabinus]
MTRIGRYSFSAWDSICCPIEKGGLGFRHLDIQNEAFLMKLAFRLIFGKDVLWFRAASLSTFVVLITLCFLLPYNFQVRELDRFGFWFDSVAQAKQVLDKVVHFCLTLR